MRVRAMLLSLAAAGAAVAATLGSVAPASAVASGDYNFINVATAQCLYSEGIPVVSVQFCDVYPQYSVWTLNGDLTYHGQPTNYIQFINVPSGGCLDYYGGVHLEPCESNNMYQLFEVTGLNIVGYNGTCLQADFEGHVFMAACGSGNTIEQEWYIANS
jgi:hypothetical protein